METQLRKDIIEFLTPLPAMQGEKQRRAALLAAGLDKLLAQTDLSGSPRDAVVLLVNRLEHYGLLGETPALVLFLREIAGQVGQDKQKQIQDFCERLHEPRPNGTLIPRSADQPEKTWDVFVCYAKEDLDRARKLYHELRDSGVQPWMAYENILPGQDWEYEITQALTQSRYVLALLSSNSVSRRGFIQKELKHALDVLDGLPPSTIFLIPARLDECEPFDGRLQQLHWVDLFPDYSEGLQRILRVLNPDAVATEPVTRTEANKEKPAREEPGAASRPKPTQRRTPPSPTQKPVSTQEADANQKKRPDIILRSEPLVIAEEEMPHGQKETRHLFHCCPCSFPSVRSSAQPSDGRSESSRTLKRPVAGC